MIMMRGHGYGVVCQLFHGQGAQDYMIVQLMFGQFGNLQAKR